MRMVIALSTLAIAAACSDPYSDAAAPPASDAGDDAVATGDGGGSEAGVTDAGVTDASGPCPSGRGPAMVLVTEPGRTSFCIDSTEVTKGQYAVFLESGPSLLKQSPECVAANASFVPPAWSLDVATAAFPVGVSLCQAEAFCAWAGKRLCRAPDGGKSIGGSATTSEWTAACSRWGSRPVPYGVTADASACNVPPRDSGLLPVGSLATCEGAYDGIFDMVGNLDEWEDNCETPPPDASAWGCGTRGGAYFDGEYPICTATRGAGSGEAHGIRCCAAAH